MRGRLALIFFEINVLLEGKQEQGCTDLSTFEGHNRLLISLLAAIDDIQTVILLAVHILSLIFFTYDCSISFFFFLFFFNIFLIKREIHNRVSMPPPVDKRSSEWQRKSVLFFFFDILFALFLKTEYNKQDTKMNTIKYEELEVPDHNRVHLTMNDHLNICSIQV